MCVHVLEIKTAFHMELPLYWEVLVVCFALAVKPACGLTRRAGGICILVVELKLV